MTYVQRTNFYYDPVRSGYDTNSWRTISGTPQVTGGGRMIFDSEAGIAGAAIHYADFVKGEITFDLNVPAAPNPSDIRTIGVAGLSSGDYIRFYIASELLCQTSNNGTTSQSSGISWNSDWTSTNTIFTIRWEAGTAKFFIDDTQVYTVTDGSVPYGPLSLYISENAENPMTVGNIAVRGTQSFFMHDATSDASTNATIDATLFISDSVTVTEDVSLTVV